MTISVLVTTYKRLEHLRRCLDSLVSQNRLPDQIVLVVRASDEPTRSFVRSFIATYSGPVDLVRAEVAEPGVVAANKAGLPLVKGEILSFIDDDAAARPDWIEKIERRFAGNPKLGGLGGRDLQHAGGGIVDEPAGEIGRVRWYGRVIGNHNKRRPGFHPADVLKGCNMSFRNSLVKEFDDAIIGNAHYYEMDLCFAVHRAGYEIWFDGDLVVDHYLEAPRHLPGNRKPDDPERFYFAHHNLIYIMLKNLSLPRRVAFLFYTFGVGAAAGAANFLMGRPAGRPSVLRAAFAGRIAGIRSYMARRKGRSGELRRAVY